MTAHDLIASIFSRTGPWNRGLPGEMRALTPKQFAELKRLIDADEEGGAVRNGMNGSLIWLPSGRWKYILTEDPASGKLTLTRLANLVSNEAGTLFG